jgi:hypothetical protein
MDSKKGRERIRARAHSAHDGLAIAARSRGTLALGAIGMAAPAVGLTAGGVLALRGARTLGLCIMGASLGVALVRWQLARLFTEKVPYEIETTVGELEIRRYAPHVRAETNVESIAWRDTLQEGFERIARYISGANDARMRIAMTAPVFATFTGGDEDEEDDALFDLTRALVATTGDAPGLAHDRTVSFVMPSTLTVDHLPWPDDARVWLRRVQSHRMAVLPFRGDYKDETLLEHATKELRRRVRVAGMDPKGAVTFAGYDAPSTLPMFRRNEVAVAIET